LRTREGEDLKPDSPMIRPTEFHRQLVGRHIRTTNIGDMMMKAIRNAGFEWRPYVLRRYFDVRLTAAEADGLITRDWRV